MLRLCAVDEVVGLVDAEAKLRDAGFVPLTGMWHNLGAAEFAFEGEDDGPPNCVCVDGDVHFAFVWLLSDDATALAEVGEGAALYSVLASGALVQTPQNMWSAFDLLRPVVGHFDRGENGADPADHAAWVAEVSALEQTQPVVLARDPGTTLFLERLKGWMMNASIDLMDVAIGEGGRSSYCADDPQVPVTPAIVAAAGPRRSLAELRASCVVEARDDGWIDDEPPANPSISAVAPSEPG